MKPELASPAPSVWGDYQTRLFVAFGGIDFASRKFANGVTMEMLYFAGNGRRVSRRTIGKLKKHFAKQ